MLLALVFSLGILAQSELLFPGATLRSSTGKTYVIDSIPESESHHIEVQIGCARTCLNQVNYLNDHDKLLTALHYCGCSSLLRQTTEKTSEIVEDTETAAQTFEFDTQLEQSIEDALVAEYGINRINDWKFLNSVWQTAKTKRSQTQVENTQLLIKDATEVIEETYTLNVEEWTERDEAKQYEQGHINSDLNEEIEIESASVNAEAASIEGLTIEEFHETAIESPLGNIEFVEIVVEIPVEAAVEEPVEASVQETVEIEVEEIVEATAQETVEIEVEEIVEASVQETVEIEVEEIVEATAQETIEASVEETIEATAEIPVEEIMINEPIQEETVSEVKETKKTSPKIKQSNTWIWASAFLVAGALYVYYRKQKKSPKRYYLLEDSSDCYLKL